MTKRFMCQNFKPYPHLSTSHEPFTKGVEKSCFGPGNEGHRRVESVQNLECEQVVLRPDLCEWLKQITISF